MTLMLTVIAPMFALIFVGYLAGFARRFSPSTTQTSAVLNSVLFHFALPAFIFSAVTRSSPTAGFPWQAVLIAAGVTVLLSVGLYFLARALGGRTRAGAGPISLGGSYGNVGYFGIPICLSVLGPEAGLAAGIVHTVHNLIYLTAYPVVRTAVHAREQAAVPPERGTLWRTRVRPILRRAVLGNPVLWAMALALLVVSTGLEIPALVDEAVGLLGQIAVPLALFCVGLALHPAIAGLRSGGVPWGGVTLGAISKVLILPALTFAVVLPFSADLGPVWAGTLVLMAAMPSSTTIYVFTQEYDGDGRLAAAILVFTTIASALTLPIVAELLL